MKSALASVLVCGALLPVWVSSQTTPVAGRRWDPADVNASIDRVVIATMERFDVPGVSIAVVKDGRQVIAKGYGVRRLGAPERVDERTVFGLASNTKVLTAAAIGVLVDEGKLTWDTPVSGLLPWFRLSDPDITRQLTVRDLLTHRVLGPNVGNLLFTPTSSYTRREVAEHLRYLPIVNPFRSTYTYAGTMFMVAGEVIEAASGQSYEDFVARRLFEPMGMTTSTVRLERLGKSGNVAAPHADVDGALSVIHGDLGSNANPARGFTSNAVEMSHWLQTFLSRGRTPAGTRLYSDAIQTALETIVTPEPLGNTTGPLSAANVTYRGYGLGLQIQDYRGKKLVMHGGVNPGFVSRVAWIPEMGLGVSITTNSDVISTPFAILYSIVDGYLGASDPDWISSYAVPVRRAARSADATSPGMPLARYTGTYSDDWYGEVTVALEGAGLVIRFPKTPALVGDLIPVGDHNFSVHWRDREIGPDGRLMFLVNQNQTVTEIQGLASLYGGLADFAGLHLKPKH